MENNKIDSIKRNSFKGLSKLQVLNLKSNRIKSIESYSFETNIYLSKLDISLNNLTEIENNTFNSLNYLTFYLNLSQNSIININLNSFNNSNIQRIILKMDNLAISNIESLTNSLKVILIKHYYATDIYDTIYIENRIDLDCEKTLWFMRHKLMYNYFNEHFDALYFSENCNNKTKLEISLKRYKKLQESIVDLNEKLPDLYVVIVCVFIVFILFSFLLYFNIKTPRFSKILLLF